jgi:stalled ribosome rescue protein Dom34
MSLNHAVIWIDHKEAHVMFLSQEASEAEVIRSKSTHTHLHHKANEIGSGKVALDTKYLHAVINAVNESKEILILGPGLQSWNLLSMLTSMMQRLQKRLLV